MFFIKNIVNIIIEQLFVLNLSFQIKKGPIVQRIEQNFPKL